jgi:hypothetical protein
MSVTPDELRALLPSRPNKFHARRTYCAELARTFASAHEAEVAVTLHRRQQAGEIRHLAFQVRWPIDVGDAHVCDYVVDFQYEERQPDGHQWWLRLADAKGVATPVWKIKKRLMAALYGIDVQEL